ncbi:MAG TPA: hypothetical protein VIL85_09210 [Thermomicrobiales bacterium]|jgi:hypothetical protein
MNKADFLDPENWHGGPTYELALAWPGGDDRQILQALEALWQVPGFAGPWERLSQYPDTSPIGSTLDRDGSIKVYGLLTLADHTQLGCIVFTILEEKPGNTDTLDWLFIAIYHGMQQKAFDFVYSDQLRRDNLWLTEVDEQYLRIAEHIYSVVPFTVAVIDFEGPVPLDRSSDLSEMVSRCGSGCLLPANNGLEHWSSHDWAVRQSGLRWLPPHQD